MAKQNPATDPVSAAMSAIESVLNLTDVDGAVSVESAPPPQLVPAKATTATPVLKPSPLPAEASTLLRPGPSSAASAPESEAKSAIPTTAHSRTAGCATITPSTSTGETQIPPALIMSSERPAWKK